MYHKSTISLENSNKQTSSKISLARLQLIKLQPKLIEIEIQSITSDIFLNGICSWSIAPLSLPINNLMLCQYLVFGGLYTLI